MFEDALRRLRFTSKIALNRTPAFEGKIDTSLRIEIEAIFEEEKRCKFYLAKPTRYLPISSRLIDRVKAKTGIIFEKSGEYWYVHTAMPGEYTRQVINNDSELIETLERHSAHLTHSLGREISGDEPIREVAREYRKIGKIPFYRHIITPEQDARLSDEYLQALFFCKCITPKQIDSLTDQECQKIVAMTECILSGYLTAVDALGYSLEDAKKVSSLFYPWIDRGFLAINEVIEFPTERVEILCLREIQADFIDEKLTQDDIETINKEEYINYMLSPLLQDNYLNEEDAAKLNLSQIANLRKMEDLLKREGLTFAFSQNLLTNMRQYMLSLIYGKDLDNREPKLRLYELALLSEEQNSEILTNYCRHNNLERMISEIHTLLDQKAAPAVSGREEGGGVSEEKPDLESKAPGLFTNEQLIKDIQYYIESSSKSKTHPKIEAASTMLSALTEKAIPSDIFATLCHMLRNPSSEYYKAVHDRTIWRGDSDLTKLFERAKPTLEKIVDAYRSQHLPRLGSAFWNGRQGGAGYSSSLPEPR